MNTRTLAIVLLSIFFGAAVGVIGSYVYTQTLPALKAATPTETYLTFKNSTHLYLVNSTLKYEGESIVIENTVRNDYDKDYYFSITADLHTSNGEKLKGAEYITDAPGYGFAVVYVPSHETKNFELHFNYSKQDIKHYELFLAYEPYDSPPP